MSLYLVVAIVLGFIVGGALALGLVSWALDRFWNSF